jgi:Skp family chaperone for outer membrane proteins
MTQNFKAAVLTIVLAGMVVCLPQNGFAQVSKIAVVDVQALTLASDEGKAIGDKLEKRYQEISAELQKAQKDIEDKETRLRTQDRLMSATAKAQLAKDIESAKVVFDRKNQDYQKEMDDLQRDLLAPVASKAQEMLALYVEEKGFTLLIDVSAEQGNVVWANPANNVTPDVMKLLNEAYKKSPPAAAAPASTPAAQPKAPTPAAPTKPPATTPGTSPAPTTPKN